MGNIDERLAPVRKPCPGCGITNTHESMPEACRDPYKARGEEFSNPGDLCVCWNCGTVEMVLEDNVSRAPADPALVLDMRRQFPDLDETLRYIKARGKVVEVPGWKKT